jgi:hypothetical protein
LDEFANKLRKLAGVIRDVPDDRSFADGQAAAAEFISVLPREAARGFTEVTTPIGSGEFARGFEAAVRETGLDCETGEHVYERLTSLDRGERIRERVKTLKVSWK